MAGIKDVARAAGVGIGTVSRVLNSSGYVSEEARRKVQAAVQELNYSPNFRAQSLKRQHSGVVGLFVPTIHHPFFSKVAQELENMLDRSGYKMMLVCSQDSVEKEKSVIHLLAQNRMDGAIFITHHQHNDIMPSYPIVTLDRHLGKGIPCITSDNYESTYRAVELLAERGCRRIGYIGGKPSVHSEVEKRVAAYRDAMKKLGFAERCLYEEIRHGEEAVFAEKYFARFPDADGIFASGDVLAHCICREAQGRGIAVPQQLKVIAYDGIIGTWIQRPSITSIRQDIHKLSEAIVVELLKKIRGEPFEEKVVVPTLFVEGETV